MSANNDGGPAFPVNQLSQDDHGLELITEFTGMSLRDWFAGQALTGFMASCLRPGPPVDERALAESSYGIADAMLSEREK